MRSGLFEGMLRLAFRPVSWFFRRIGAPLEGGCAIDLSDPYEWAYPIVPTKRIYHPLPEGRLGLLDGKCTECNDGFTEERSRYFTHVSGDITIFFHKECAPGWLHQVWLSDDKSTLFYKLEYPWIVPPKP